MSGGPAESKTVTVSIAAALSSGSGGISPTGPI